MAQANLVARLSLNDSGFAAGLQRSELNAKKFASRISGFGTGLVSRNLTALGGALTAGLSARAFVGAISGSIELGSKLHDLGEQTGISVSELYKLKSSFEDSGKSIEDVGPAIARMQKAIGTGGEAFGKLGINFEKIKNLKPSEQFQSIARDIIAIENPAQRTAAAMAIFGKSGASLIPVFNDIARVDLSRLSKVASIMERNADSFDKFGDSLKQAQRNVEVFKVSLTSGLLKGLQGGTDDFNAKDWSGLGEKFGRFLSEGFAKGKKMFDQDVKDIKNIGKLFGLGGKDAPAPELKKPDTGVPERIDEIGTSGFGKLETFKSFVDPRANPANFPGGKSMADEERFNAFFHPEVIQGGKLKPVGSYSSLTSTGAQGMGKAYGQVYGPGSTPPKTSEAEDKSLTKSDLESVMSKYWGGGE